jgi:antigen KI-67
VGTPHIPLEEFVSPLSSSRKQKSLRWQDVSTSIQKRNSEPAIKRRHISAKNDGNVTSPSDSPVHVLSPQQLFSSSLIDEPVHTFCAEGRGWKSRENSFSDGVKTRASPKNASPNGHAIQKMKKISPTFNFSGFSRIDRLSASSRISKSFENDLRNISGVQELMKARSTPKSSVNDLSGVRGGRKRMTVPRTPKSPKDFLTDVHVMEQPTKERRSPKSPKNDLGDVRGVRNLMKTPRSPTKSPKNDLRDVHGVRNLMKTPRSPKSPKNDLTDVRGVKRLMTSPKTVKSPLNDLSDVRGVKRLMTTYQVTKSPKNDISDVDGVKELLETPSPRSVRNNWTVTDDAHHLEKTPSTSPSPRSGSRAAWTHSKPKSPDGPSVSGKVPSIATRTHHRQTSGKTTPVKWSPKYIKTEVPVTDKSDAEGSVDQMNVPMPEEVKVNNYSLILSLCHIH